MRWEDVKWKCTEVASEGVIAPALISAALLLELFRLSSFSTTCGKSRITELCMKEWQNHSSDAALLSRPIQVHSSIQTSASATCRNTPPFPKDLDLRPPELSGTHITI